MNQERLPEENFFIAIQEYFKLGPLAGVNNFVLKGPIDVPTRFKTIIGVFPIPGKEDERNYLMLTTEKNQEPLLCYSKILDLEPPQRTRGLAVDNRVIREFSEHWAAAQKMPSIAIGIGEAVKTEEEVIVLFSVWGISPEKALKEIQEATRLRKIKLN